jgi:hypothetical protein
MSREAISLGHQKQTARSMASGSVQPVILKRRSALKDLAKAVWLCAGLRQIKHPA